MNAVKTETQIGKNKLTYRSYNLSYMWRTNCVVRFYLKKKKIIYNNSTILLSKTISQIKQNSSQLQTENIMKYLKNAFFHNFAFI